MAPKCERVMVNFPSETAPCVPAHKVIYPKYYKHWLYSGPIHWIVWFIAYFDPKNYFLRPIWPFSNFHTNQIFSFLVWIFYLFCSWKFEKKVKRFTWDFIVIGKNNFGLPTKLVKWMSWFLTLVLSVYYGVALDPIVLLILETSITQSSPD